MDSETHLQCFAQIKPCSLCVPEVSGNAELYPCSLLSPEPAETVSAGAVLEVHAGLCLPSQGRQHLPCVAGEAEAAAAQDEMGFSQWLHYSVLFPPGRECLRFPFLKAAALAYGAGPTALTQPLSSSSGCFRIAS